MLITSKSNEKVKFVKSLNEKKFRQKNNAYYQLVFVGHI